MKSLRNLRQSNSDCFADDVFAVSTTTAASSPAATTTMPTATTTLPGLKIACSLARQQLVFVILVE